jgi:transcriptional regulator with XRE-family HTH domain
MATKKLYFATSSFLKNPLCQMKVGNNLRKIREMKGFSQDYLAKKLGISPQAYSKLEREKTRMDVERLDSIAHLLQVNAEDIIDFDESKIFQNPINTGGNVSVAPDSSSRKREGRQKLPGTLEDLVQQLRETSQHLRKTNELLFRYLEIKK